MSFNAFFFVVLFNLVHMNSFFELTTFTLLHFIVCQPSFQPADINSEVYRNASFLEKSAWKQAALILLAALSYPLLFLVWLILDSCFSSHNLARIFRSPCFKFLIHCGSYQTFLFLLAFSAFVSKSEFLAYGITGK